MSKPLHLPILILTICVGLNAQADSLGLNVGATTWTPTLTGDFKSTTPASSTISLGNDINLNEKPKRGLAFSLEHPIPSLPNVRFQGTSLDKKGYSQLNSNLNFNGTTFNSGDQVQSEFDLSHEDIVLYYEVVDNLVNINLGLDIKRLDGHVSMSSNNSTTRLAVDETLPLLYFSARYDVPGSGFYLGADLINDPQLVDLNTSLAEDRTVKVGYESRNGLGIEGGLKNFKLDLDNSNSLDTNLEFQGLFLNGYLHF